MGQAIIIRDNARTGNKVNAQTLQSAYQNGVLTNATSINTSDPFHTLNQPHIVTSTSENAPWDIGWGIREVYFRAAGTAVLTIIGVSNVGEPSIWTASVTTNGVTTSVGDWFAIRTPVPFTGATALANGTAGSVPAPTSADVDKVLLGNGSWGLVRRTVPISSISKGNNGVITLTYVDGTSETLTQTDSSHYTVVERDSSGNTVRTYVTTVDNAGNVSVQITEAS